MGNGGTSSDGGGLHWILKFGMMRPSRVDVLTKYELHDEEMRMIDFTAVVV